MKTKSILTAFFISFLFYKACAGQSDTDAAVKANNAFTIDLFKELAKQPGNIIVSPFSVDATLTMAYAGAHGETASQMAKVLHIPANDAHIHTALGALLEQLDTVNGDGCEFLTANSLWAQKGYPFEHPYLKFLHKQYGAGLNQFDTGWPNDFDTVKAAVVRKTINDWVNARTRGNITALLPNTLPSSATRFIMADAVYFKGAWAIPFKKSQTRDSAFNIGATQTVSVPMMHLGARFLSGYLEIGARFVELPYNSNRLSMIILLPRDENSFAELVQGLGNFLPPNESTKADFRDVELALPKFKITSDFDLRKPLMEMGMAGAFFETADFSGITSERPFFVEAALHKADVEVDENGTVASAATAIGMTNGIVFRFDANHPFLFCIRDNRTSAILFIGRVTNPLE